MSETNYYIRNWARILIFLAICSAAEIIFSSAAVIAKVILIGILLSNNKKFMYLAENRNDYFKKYYQSLKACCILFGVSLFTILIEYITFQAILMANYNPYDYTAYINWIETYGRLISIWFGVGQYSLMFAGLILEIIAWSNLKKSFEENLLGTRSYHKENFIKGAKILIWGAAIVAFFYIGDIGYVLFDFIFDVPIYNPYWGYSYSILGFLGYSLWDMVFILVKWAGLVLLCIGHATLGSNFRNPYFSGISSPMLPKVDEMGPSTASVIKSPKGYNFCSHCGSKTHPEGKFCPSCGKTIP